MKEGFGNLMKQAQQMQENLRKVQEEIAGAEVTGEAGAGLVRVVMTGTHDLKRVHIDRSLIGDDTEMLEDLIAAAVNDANRRVESLSREKMSDFSSTMGLPPGFNLPL